MVAVHVATLRTIGAMSSPAAAYLSLWAWSQLPTGRWPAYPLRFCQSDVARITGVSRWTVARAWPEVCRYWERRDDGWYPRRDVWPEPDGPFDRIGAELAVGLRVLQTERRAGWSAWRLCLQLMGRLRAAASRGQRWVVASTRATCRALGMGATALQRALARLARLGLLERTGGRQVDKGPGYAWSERYRRTVRRLGTACGLVSSVESRSGSHLGHNGIDPPPAARHGYQTEAPPREARAEGDRPARPLRARATGTDEIAPALAAALADARGARPLARNELAGAEVLAGAGVAGRPLRALARWLSSAPRARRWLVRNAGWRAADNPGGWLWVAACSGGAPAPPPRYDGRDFPNAPADERAGLAARRNRAREAPPATTGCHEAPRATRLDPQPTEIAPGGVSPTPLELRDPPPAGARVTEPVYETAAAAELGWVMSPELAAALAVPADVMAPAALGERLAELRDRLFGSAD